MKYCKRCKKEFDIEENECPICGKQLAEASKSQNEEINEYEASEMVSAMMTTGIL